jgi:hypothetical protein
METIEAKVKADFENPLSYDFDELINRYDVLKREMEGHKAQKKEYTGVPRGHGNVK